MDRILIDEASEILVGRGQPDPLLPPRNDRDLAVVIHQPSVSRHAEHLATAIEATATRAVLLEVPDRDQAKTIEVVGDVYTRMAEVNVGRHDTVVGVGGGAATDLAGFVAATWLRGIESVLVPTTLLGAVDAAIGGKTGINHAGKNLVGAFWYPTRVVVDLDVLDRLPRDLKVEGSAEILKAGFIADPSILDAYRRHGVDTPLDAVVAPAIAAKAAVVSGDFRESGRRAILNFGHTLGHGIETVTGISHGHAVGIGMVAAAKVSEHRFGFDPAPVVELVSLVGLPIEAPGAPRTSVLELVARDKKRNARGVRMVLLRAPADPVVEPVSEAELDLGLMAVGVT